MAAAVICFWRCYSSTTTSRRFLWLQIYLDSQRPPVSTPTGYVNPAMGSTVTVTDPAPTTNKLTIPKASTTIENITVTNVAPKYSDYNDIAAYSLAVADYFMAKIMAIYGSGNTALNRYGFGR